MRNRRRDTLRILMTVLVVLAILATVILLVTNNQNWTKVALLCALWAAFVGVILTTRLSNYLGAEIVKNEQLEAQRSQELDLARNDYIDREVLMENQYLRQLQEQHDETMNALRIELAKMRQQLADFGYAEDFIQEQQASLRASAQRIKELQEAKPQPAPAERPTFTPEGFVSDDFGVHPVSNSAKVSPLTPPPEAPRQDPKPPKDIPPFATGTFTAVKLGNSESEEAPKIPLIVELNDYQTPAENVAADKVADTAQTTQQKVPQAPSNAQAEKARAQVDSQAQVQQDSNKDANVAADTPRDTSHQGGTHEGAGLSVADLAAKAQQGHRSRRAPLPAEESEPHDALNFDIPLSSFAKSQEEKTAQSYTDTVQGTDHAEEVPVVEVLDDPMHSSNSHSEQSATLYSALEDEPKIVEGSAVPPTQQSRGRRRRARTSDSNITVADLLNKDG